MAHPMRKHTKHRKGKRRGSSWRLSFPTLTRCAQCAQPVIPHQACSKCGYYRGRQVVVIREKKKAKQGAAKAA